MVYFQSASAIQQMRTTLQYVDPREIRSCRPNNGTTTIRISGRAARQCPGTLTRGSPRNPNCGRSIVWSTRADFSWIDILKRCSHLLDCGRGLKINHVQNGKFWGARDASLPSSADCRALFLVAPSLDFETLECGEQAALGCRLTGCAAQSCGIGTKTNTSALICL